MTGCARRMPELLAPAGGRDAFLAAVAAGADAVYVGTGDFDARTAAPGVDLGELAALSILARRHGCRTYVTLNSLAADDELDAMLERACSVLDAGADALIVADPGLALGVARLRPGAELHLSTQAGVQSAEAASLAARELAVARVTCARELSLSEIESVCLAGVEVEAFCHGAICVGYSGACALSALACGRSAMHGDCAQPCRLGWRLEDEGGRRLSDARADRLLCPRDLCSARRLTELVATGVAALKIEGRMKNPDYVYNVVGAYREALDALARGGEVDAAVLERRLARSFNRGFTDDYLAGRSGDGLMSPVRACNQGARVGRVASRAPREALVALEDAVGAGDVLEIRSTPAADAPADVPERWPQVGAPRDAAPGELLTVRCKRKVEPGSPVHLVRSARVVARAAAAVERLAAELARVAASVSAPSYPGPGMTVPRPGADQVPACPPAPPAGPARGPLARPAVSAVAADPAAARALAGAGADELLVPADALLDAAPGAWEVPVPVAALLDVVARPADLERARAAMAAADRVVCRNLGQIELARALGVPFDAMAPVPCWNARAAMWLAGLGARRVWLAAELGTGRLERLASLAPGLAGCLVLGRPRAMTAERCVLASEGPCDGVCARCRRRREGRYLAGGPLPDGVRAPVRVDGRGRTAVLSPWEVDRVDRVPGLLRAGAGALLVDAASLDAGRAAQAVRAVVSARDGVRP